MIGTNTEPAIVVGTITSIVAAGLTFMQAFGVDLSDSQQDAIRNFIAVLAPLIVALIVRGLVFSKNTVENKVDESFILGKQGVNDPPKVA